jgi:NhaP-type Na+/H+ or K+/H+ antiporter
MLGLGLLGLHNLGEFGVQWVLVDVVWATVAGISIGALAGFALAHVGRALRGHPPQHELMNDFLGLGLIGVVYGLCLLVDAWGFLAVFFAAVALRQTELKIIGVDAAADAASPIAEADLTPAGENGDVLPAQVPPPDSPPTISERSLVFKEHLERLSELVLVLLIGGALFVDSWSLRAVALALFLFVVVRPVSVVVGLVGTRSSWRMRGMVGWFGVRGIGSLYYLMYAIQHGLPEPLAIELIQLTLIAVTLSIFVHGTSVKPLMSRFWKTRKLPPGP